jgi:hypothetical protein
MKLLGVIGTTGLFLVLGITTPAYAQQEQEKEKEKDKQEQPAKPPKQEERAKPEKQQDQAKGQQEQQRQQQDKSAKQEQKEQAKGQQEQQRQQPDKPAKQEPREQARGQQEQQPQQQASQRPQRTHEAEVRQRAEPALRLSARGGGRIPEERFHSNFGREHAFRVGSPVLVGGYSRFQYGGYWFGFVEPWPVDWYYTDDVYIDYVDGGYYMYDPYYPGTRFAISVVI